ncbi:MAG: calcium/sodium antiporter [Spirochaetales bacterium]|nr:calcium/sodium antiporter [Spirochaetales bacterium]
MDLIFTLILFLTGFAVLIKGADFLVEGSSSLAKKFKISKLVMGLTVVAMGTSLPELFVNIFASINNAPELAIANVLGSNIANILLILGISSIIYPLTVTKGTVYKEIPFSLLAVLVLGILVNEAFLDGAGKAVLTRSDSIILICFFIIFLYYTFSIAKADDSLISEISIKEYGTLKSVLYIVIGIGGLGLGGKLIVDQAIWFAEKFNISQNIIGLTVVSLGTSLPELATSAVAAYRKNTDIAVGNVVGSNIFNVFFILGISGLISPIPFLQENNMDIFVLVTATLILFISMFTGKRSAVDRWEGVIFVIGYVLYICYLMVRL